MKKTMVIPSYWERKREEGWRESDNVYDHPTPLDEEGTLGRILESLSILENKNFNLVVLGAATSQDIQREVELKVSSIVNEADLAFCGVICLFKGVRGWKLGKNVRDLWQT